MTKSDDDFYQVNTHLSDREIYSIGKIIALWGALEHVVFIQTLETFDDAGDEVELPKAMNNLRFTGVLDLWKTRVVDNAQGDCGKVLQRQYERIVELHPFRNALVHGMWQWSPAAPSEISVVRIARDQVITTSFDADSLEDFCRQLGGINFKIHYPGGRAQYARERTESGFGLNRLAYSLMTSNPVVEELLQSHPQTKIKLDEA
jgi:hypothetical protein